MAKGGKTSTTTNGPDAATSAWNNQIMGYAKQAGDAGAPGANPLSTAAGNYYGGTAAAGNLGMGALSGDAASVQKLMNPYQQQVIDANNAAWQKTNAQTAAQTGSAATGAGAFGGSRYGVALGTALSANNVQQGAQTAGLLSSGYTGAMNQANSLANFGMQGAAGSASMGDYLRQIQMQQAPGAYQMQMMKQGLSGLNTGTVGTQTGPPGNWLTGAVGGATSGATLGGQYGGGWGALGGGVVGGLLGGFGS